MKKLSLATKIILFSLMFTANLCQAQPASQSNRIESLLRELEKPYESNLGDYVLNVAWSDTMRSQRVYIAGETVKLDNDVMIRKFYSPALKLKKDLTKEQMEKILSINSTRTIGAFMVTTGLQGEKFIAFLVTIPDDFNSSTLSEIISYAGANADNMEAELNSNKDEL